MPTFVAAGWVCSGKKRLTCEVGMARLYLITNYFVVFVHVSKGNQQPQIPFRLMYKSFRWKKNSNSFEIIAKTNHLNRAFSKSFFSEKKIVSLSHPRLFIFFCLTSTW